MENREQKNAAQLVNEYAILKARSESLAAEAKEKVARIKAKLERDLDPLKARQGLIESNLKEVFRIRKTAGEIKGQTMKVIGGSFGFRKNPDRLETLRDHEEIISELEKSGALDFLVIFKSINETALKSAGRKVYGPLGFEIRSSSRFFVKPEPIDLDKLPADQIESVIAAAKTAAENEEKTDES